MVELAAQLAVELAASPAVLRDGLLAELEPAVAGVVQHLAGHPFRRVPRCFIYPLTRPNPRSSARTL